MYKSLQYTYFNNRTFVQFFRHFISTIEKSNPETLQIKTQFDNLSVPVNELFNLTQRDRGSELSEDLVEIDKRRDNCWLGIDYQLQSYRYHYNLSKKEATIELERSLLPFGTGISRLKYVEETITINGIIEKWESNAELQEHISQLGLSEWVAKLKEENLLFDNKFKERVEERANEPEVKSIELRKTIIEHYRTLLKHLTAHTTLSTDNTYDTINSKINELIEEYNKMIPKKEETVASVTAE